MAENFPSNQLSEIVCKTEDVYVRFLRNGSGLSSIPQMGPWPPKIGDEHNTTVCKTGKWTQIPRRAVLREAVCRLSGQSGYNPVHNGGGEEGPGHLTPLVT